MKVHWKKLMTQTAIWMASEIVLNLIGLDALADYSEFLLEAHDVSYLQELSVVKDRASGLDDPLARWTSHYRFGN